jgi:N-hydroxyarylamine O-acetyltransferase
MSQTWSTCESLTSEQVERYLTHIGLDVDATLARSPNRALLEDVQIAHITRVPFDTSAIHLPDSVNDETFELKRGPGIPLDIAGAYINIVERSRGGYCFVLNGLFAALLRALGFRVSELTARVYMLRNKDPSEAGWLWSPTTHVR